MSQPETARRLARRGEEIGTYRSPTHHLHTFAFHIRAGVRPEADTAWRDGVCIPGRGAGSRMVPLRSGSTLARWCFVLLLGKKPPLPFDESGCIAVLARHTHRRRGGRACPAMQHA
eukprot:362705-Chlamydomonas_euryale.AAC.5